MDSISTFDSRLATLQSTTYHLLMSSNLVVHPNVTRIVLHGSRGLADRYRPDSDVDLSLLIEPGPWYGADKFEALLKQILQTTLNNWRGPVALDLAAIFEMFNCGLKCFEQTAYDASLCKVGGTDCFGIYKMQHGSAGFFVNRNVEVKLMYPCLEIWRRA